MVRSRAEDSVRADKSVNLFKTEPSKRGRTLRIGNKREFPHFLTCRTFSVRRKAAHFDSETRETDMQSAYSP